MNILALDTSMGACSAAVLQANGAMRLHAREQHMARGHAEALMPMIAEVMGEAGLEFAELDRIAATLGPGSFTGVRIAIAAARGFALVTKAKLWGTDSLTVMARQARNEIDPDGGFAIAVDARRAMLYFGLFDRVGRCLQGPLLIAPDEAAARLPDSARFAFGSGATLLQQAASAIGRSLQAALPDLQPSAVSLAELALAANADLPALRPLYLRPPDAKPQVATGVARS